MLPPTTAQQLGLAYSQMPFAALSLLSSVYVIYHIACRRRQKLQRLYHRLVLALNVAVVPLSLIYLLGQFLVPEGTEYYPAASGNQQTCTAGGFIAIMFTLIVPFYYASLIIQAYLAMKHKFKEEEYVWIEKWIHLVAYAIPLALASAIAGTHNFNPAGQGCSIAKAPKGCEGNPDIACERGEDIEIVVYIIGFGQIALYFIIPPACALAMYCWIGRLQKKMESSRGMQRVRAYAKNKMWQSVARQIALYLLSFWGTFLLTLVHFVYKTITGQNVYNLLILANCVFALQGFVMAAVYFALERMGRPRVKCLPNHTASTRRRQDLTVEDIRLNAKTKSEAESSAVDSEKDFCAFNIFDGTPDADSPWAKYIDQEDSCSVDGDVPC